MAIYDTLITNRNKYPTPMSNAQLGQLLNETSYAHKNEGYGMLRKETGSNCPQPVTGILCSRDIICIVVGADLVLYDCLIDAEGKATPTWDRKKPLQDLSRWTESVDPKSEGSETPPPPQAAKVPPYNESYAVQFGQGCNAVYLEANTATFDPGMISVHSSRAAWDYYSGTMPWDQSYKKHINEFRAEYGLPPV